MLATLSWSDVRVQLRVENEEEMVMTLEVGSNTWKVNDRVNSILLERIFIAYPRELRSIGQSGLHDKVKYLYHELNGKQVT